MIIYHVDKGGRRWRFGLPDCTKQQAAAFARTLRAVSNIRVYRQRAPGFRETPAERRNALFCERVEQGILNALAEQFPVMETDETKNEYFVL